MFTYLLHVSASHALRPASQRALLRLRGGHPLVIDGARGQRAHRGFKHFCPRCDDSCAIAPRKEDRLVVPEMRFSLFVDSSNLRRSQRHIPACNCCDFSRALVLSPRARPADAIVAHAAACACRNPNVHRLAGAPNVECSVTHGRGGTDAFAYGYHKPPCGVSRDVVACAPLIARIELWCSVRWCPVTANAKNTALSELAVVALVVRGGRGTKAVMKQSSVIASRCPLQPYRADTRVCAIRFSAGVFMGLQETHRKRAYIPDPP